jgi:hypothetical protein
LKETSFMYAKNIIPSIIIDRKLMIKFIKKKKT